MYGNGPSTLEQNVTSYNCQKFTIAYFISSQSDPGNFWGGLARLGIKYATVSKAGSLTLKQMLCVALL